MSERAQHHPNYVRIWLILVALLTVSLVLGFVGFARTAVVLIFAIAVIKAWLVASYYMHLRFEPRWLTILILSALLCVIVLFVGLLPDIAHKYGG
jgi:caa(3)-type oxidase subunit IV